MELKPVDLHFEDIGQGIPVLLVHGYPLDHTIWLPVVEGLKKDARFILPDLRGYGRSPETNEIYSMRLLAEDLRALIDRLGLKRVVLVGHSMGGYVTLAFAHAYPQYLSGLALVATQADADTPEKRQGRLVTARDVKRRGVAFIARSLPAKLTRDEVIQKQVAEIILGTRNATLINSLKGMAERSDSNPVLAAVKVPAVVIAGADDQLIPLARSHTMAQMLGKGWLFEVSGAGHLPMLENPEAVMDALKQLICHVDGCE